MQLAGWTCSHSLSRSAQLTHVLLTLHHHCCAAANSPSLWPPQQVSAVLSKPEEVNVAGGLGGLRPAWFDAFRQHQAFEVGGRVFV